MKIQCLTFGLLITALNGCSPFSTPEKSQVSFPKFSYEGHRGARGLAPENSILAMKTAIDIPKVTTLEMDCHITRDKKVVVFHDHFINPKFVQYSDGKPLAGKDEKAILYHYTFAELSKFDIGSKYYAAFPKQKKVPTPFCLLSDLIDSVENYANQQGKTPMFYNIETKSTAGKDGQYHPAPEEFSELILKIVRAKNIEKRTVIQSFDKRTIQYIHNKYPQIRTSYLIDDTVTQNVAALVKELGFKPFTISPHYKLVNQKFVDEAHRLGIKIIPWTVNTPEEIQVLKDLQVDGVISDYPDLY